MDKHPKKDEERVGSFHTNSWNILMESKSNPTLMWPKPIETTTKFKNKNKYCKYREDYGHTTFECRKLKKALHELTDQQ